MTERLLNSQGKRIRKPRGIKLNGRKSQDLCPVCFSFGCDPMAMSHKFDAETHCILKEGKCRGCGHKPCTCKSSLKP